MEKALLMNRGPCQMLQQETADTRVSFYTPASLRCQNNKVPTGLRAPSRHLWKGMQITGRGGDRDGSSPGTQRSFWNCNKFKSQMF